MPRTVGMNGLMDDFLILELWLYDFICDEFSTQNNFRALVDYCGEIIMSPDLPYHPCNGPFKDDMKKKLKIIERSHGSENYECIHCEVLLKELSHGG